MRKLGFIAFLTMLLLVFAAPAVSAHRGGFGHHHRAPCQVAHRAHHSVRRGDCHPAGHRRHRHHRHPGGGGGGSDPVGVQYSATASDTYQGGMIMLHGDVTNADTSVSLTVTAVVHFVTVDVPMDLDVTTKTNEFVADGMVGVGGEEPTGQCMVDFTFDYGGTMDYISVPVQILPSD
jgi:hypothetical protein